MITIRCSELDRVLLCPGSLTLCNLVDPRKGDEGTEGTALHQMAHSRMVKEMGALGEAGKEVECKSLEFSKWVSEYYYRFVNDTFPKDWALLIESAFAYEFEGFILSGHIDALAINPAGTEAIIADLKTGYDPVDPADVNEQVFGYACLLLRAYPDLQKITAYIVQPRNDEDEGFQRISEPMILEGSTLAASLFTMETRITKSLQNAMEVNSGPKQCLWCPAAMQCPAAIAERDLMKIKLTQQHIEEIQKTPDDAVLADWVVAGRVLTRPMDDAKDLAKDRIEAVGSIKSKDGIVITSKSGPGSYQYPDRPAFFRALRTLLPKDDDIAEAVTPSISKTVDVIARVNNIPKTSKIGNSATAIVNGHLKPLAIQGERVTLQFSTP